MTQGSAAATEKLYSPHLLALSTQLAAFPLDETFTHFGEARSRTCGSTLEVGFDLDENGRVDRIGCRVTACAVGQGSAAIMVGHAKGREPQDFSAALGRIDAWLAGTGPAPDWPEFDALLAAQPHSGRHGALLLPWEAINRALSTSAATR